MIDQSRGARARAILSNSSLRNNNNEKTKKKEENKKQREKPSEQNLTCRAGLNRNYTRLRARCVNRVDTRANSPLFARAPANFFHSFAEVCATRLTEEKGGTGVGFEREFLSEGNSLHFYSLKKVVSAGRSARGRSFGKIVR